MSLKDMENKTTNRWHNEQKYVLVSRVNQYDPIWEEGLYTRKELESQQVQNHFNTAKFLYFNLGQPKKIGIHHPFTTLDVMSINPKLLALDNYPQVDNAEFYFTKQQVKQIRTALKVSDEHNCNLAITGGLPYDNNGINFAHKIGVFFNLHPIAIPAKWIDKIPMQAIRDIGISEKGVKDGLRGGGLGILNMIPNDIKYDKNLLKKLQTKYNLSTFGTAMSNLNVLHYALKHWSQGQKIYTKFKVDIQNNPDSDFIGNVNSVSDLDFHLSTSISDDLAMSHNKVSYEASSSHNYHQFVKHAYLKAWKEHGKKYYTARLTLKKHFKELKPYVIKGLQADLNREQKILKHYYHFNVPAKKRYQKYVTVYEQKFIKAVAKTHDDINLNADISLSTPYLLITDAHIPNVNHKKHQFRVIEGYKKGHLITKHIPLSNHKILAKQHLFTPAEIIMLRQEMYARRDYLHVAFCAIPSKHLNLITPNRLKFILKDESNRIVFNIVESDEFTAQEWMQRYTKSFTLYQVSRNYAELHEHITSRDLANLPNVDEISYCYTNA